MNSESNNRKKNNNSKENKSSQSLDKKFFFGRNNDESKKEIEPNRRRSTRVRRTIIPEQTMKQFLEIMGEYNVENVSRKQSNIFNQHYEQEYVFIEDDTIGNNKKIEEFTSIKNNIGVNNENLESKDDNEYNKQKEVKNHNKKSENEIDNKSNKCIEKEPQKRRSTRIRHSVIPENTLRSYLEITGDFSSTYNQQQSQILEQFDEQNSENNSDTGFHQRRSKRIRHSVIPETTLKEYLEITSQLNVKHHQRGRHKKNNNNYSKISSDNIEDIEKEKIRLDNRHNREKKIQERFYKYDFITKAYQDELIGDDKLAKSQEQQSNSHFKKKNIISDYYKIDCETEKNNISKIEDKLNKEYEKIETNNSKNEISARVKNKIKSLKKKMSKKEEKKHSFNSIDSMFMKNKEKSSSLENVKNNELDKEKSENTFEIFNKKKKTSISKEENDSLKFQKSNNPSNNDSSVDKSESNKNIKNSTLGINETQPLSIIETDSFFLTSKQKQWKMQKINQQKLRKDLEESYKFHSSFAQGKAIHTFFQLAKSSSKQNNNVSLISIDTSINTTKSLSENIEYPTILMEAAYPTCWNNHVYNNMTDNRTKNNHSKKISNDIFNQQDNMNICISPSRTSSTIDIEGDIYDNKESQNEEISLPEVDEDQSSYIDIDDSSNDSNIDTESDSENDSSTDSNYPLNSQENHTSMLNEQTSTGINIIESSQNADLLSSPFPIDSSSSIETSLDDNKIDSDSSMSNEYKTDNLSLDSNNSVSIKLYKFNKRHLFSNFNLEPKDLNDFLISIIDNKEIIQYQLFERMNQISKNKVNNSNDVIIRIFKALSQINYNQFLSILFPTNKSNTPWNHFKVFTYNNDLLKKYINTCISPNESKNYPKFMDYIYPNALWTEKYSPRLSNQVLSNKNHAEEIINWLNNWKIGKTEELTSLTEVTEVSNKRGRKKHNTDSNYYPGDEDFMSYYDYNYVNYYENLFSNPIIESKGDKFLFLVGPPASGKSATIQACALECGFEILEIYPGIKRSGKDVANIIGDLTQSHIVMSMDKSLYSPKNKAQSSSINLLASNKKVLDNNIDINKKNQDDDNELNIINDDLTKELNNKKDISKDNTIKKRGRPKKITIAEADVQKNLINNYFGKKKRKMSAEISNNLNTKKENDKIIDVDEPLSTIDKDKDIIEIEKENNNNNTNDMKIDDNNNKNNIITIEDEDDRGIKEKSKFNNNKINKRNSGTQIDSSKTIISSFNKSSISSPTSPQNLTNLLIVFEEVDILMDQDKGFWASVYNIIKSTKRPIMFTGNENILKNELMQIPPNLYLSLSIQDYKMPNIEDVTIYVFYICLLEEHLVDPRDIISLCQLFNNDIRKIINQLQFLLLKKNEDTKRIQEINKEKEELKKNEEIIVIDFDENDNIPKDDDKKEKDLIQKKKNNINAKNLEDISNITQDNIKSTKDTVIDSSSKEITMEHISLDHILGIDLNLVNIYNYYLRHHMRPDLALVRTIPNYVLLPKYDQMQYQIEEICKDENELYYSALNKLYEAEVQQLIVLNNNHQINIFDEWSIHDRGGALTWMIKYKKSSRKNNKNNDNGAINEILSPSSSVMSSPGLRPSVDFASKSPTNLASSKKKVAIMDYFISDKKENKILEEFTVNNNNNNNHNNSSNNNTKENISRESSIFSMKNDNASYNERFDTDIINNNTIINSQKANIDSTSIVDLSILSSPSCKSVESIDNKDKEEKIKNKLGFSPTIQNSDFTGKPSKEKDYQDLLLLRALSDYEATISETDALISMSEDRRFQLFEIDSYGPCKDDCIGYSPICKENIKRDSPQFCISNTNYEETLNNYIGSENHLCAWVNTLAKHHLYSEVENICHSEHISQLYTSSPLAAMDNYYTIPSGEKITTAFGEIISPFDNINKDNSMMSTSSFSNEVISSNITMDNDQDPNQSILSNYLDTQMMQTLQRNNEIISIASPSPHPASISSDILHTIPLETSKESFIDPISVYTPPLFPNSSPSNIPFITETVLDNKIKISSPIINNLSSHTFSYKHKNKGKYKSKKIFDTISKKSCYWPSWIEEKSSEIYSNYCKALEYTLYNSQCAVCKNTLVVDHIPYIEKMLEIENASFESSIKCNGRKRRSASGRISKIYRHLAEIDESQVNMLIDWNMVNKLFNNNSFNQYKSSYKTLVSNLEKALQFISN
ncbi:hypothetical protein BCR36DRAFT_409247 [Piromyces finnis]|uniref:AAA+ ATPase domain-containing protein n=1 Tax=Piromyces finnis TaxID=1754191 RepID=A0A1Y1VKZ6_9FUNG|nr:hypothetical protein BCR36DRAFT_409247 [Piromyces finnis]|eukprot:ORX57776.1 hypothetical protein BCR36DRAFT_409247 [Piromyces finnis]